LCVFGALLFSRFFLLRLFPRGGCRLATAGARGLRRAEHAMLPSLRPRTDGAVRRKSRDARLGSPGGAYPRWEPRRAGFSPRRRRDQGNSWVGGGGWLTGSAMGSVIGTNDRVHGCRGGNGGRRILAPSWTAGQRDAVGSPGRLTSASAVWLGRWVCSSSSSVAPKIRAAFTATLD